MDRATQPLTEVLDSLPKLDRELLRGAAAGLTSKQIAPLIDRSHHTVDDRLKSLVRKLSACDRAHAGRMFVRYEAGLDPLDDWVPQTLGLGPAGLTRPWSPGGGINHDNASNRSCSAFRAHELAALSRDQTIAFRTGAFDADYGTAEGASARNASSVRREISAASACGGRCVDCELGRDSSSVHGSVSPLGSARAGLSVTPRPPECSLRVTREDLEVAVRPQPLSKLGGYTAALFGDRSTLADALRLFALLLGASLAVATMMLVVLAVIQTTAEISVRGSNWA